MIALMAPHFIIAAVIPKMANEAPLLPRVPAKKAAREVAADPLAYAAMGGEISQPQIKRDNALPVENRAATLEERRTPGAQAHVETNQAEPRKQSKRSSTDDDILEARAQSSSPQDLVRRERSEGIAEREAERGEAGITGRNAQGVGPLSSGAGMSNAGISGPIGFDKRGAEPESEAEAELGLSRREAQGLGPMDEGSGMSYAGISGPAGFDKREADAESESAPDPAELEPGFSRREAQGMGPLSSGAGMSYAGISGRGGFDR